MSEIIILNSGDHVVLDPIQSGFAHGFGIFETMKFAAGRLCFWEEHWQRFVRSAKVLSLHVGFAEQEVLDAIRELVRTDGLSDAVIKVSLMQAGEGSQCYVYARPAMTSGGAARLLFASDSKQNEHSLLAGHKTHNYMENMLLLTSARAVSCTDVIRVNVAGQLTETAVGNLFFVQDETLYTPGIATGVLPGVVRAVVLEAAEVLGIPVVEGAYFPDALNLMESVFVTNSSVGIQIVDTIKMGDSERTVDSAAHSMVQDLIEALATVEEGSSL
ncbi:MAG: branched-subunit amino acid aminotransferase/4-amino-4-deoxychorismate lyase, partial [Lentimonas sp.]